MVEIRLQEIPIACQEHVGVLINCGCKNGSIVWVSQSIDHIHGRWCQCKFHMGHELGEERFDRRALGGELFATNKPNLVNHKVTDNDLMRCKGSPKGFRRSAVWEEESGHDDIRINENTHMYRQLPANGLDELYNILLACPANGIRNTLHLAL